MVDGAAGLASYMLFTFIPALLIFGAIVNFLTTRPTTAIPSRISCAAAAPNNAETAGGRHFSEAADGTRTHDLLHGKQTPLARSQRLYPCKLTTSAPW
jgi:hypothetical protein